MRPLLVLSFLVASTSLAAQQRTVPDAHPTLMVGSARATRGHAATGEIVVPAGVDSGLRIPVVVVHGARPGPVLALVAGAHGSEYASIVALERLIGRLDATVMSGSVIVVPIVNVPSFQRIVPHLNPVDGKNMNRWYPGDPRGTQTQRASFQITREVIDQSDHLIDYHGGDLDENLRPYSYWTPTGRAGQDSVSKAMVLAFGLDHIIVSADRPTNPDSSKYLENTATVRRKPSITVEAGRSGVVANDDVEVLIDGTLNVMGYLKLIQRDWQPVEHPVWIDRIETVNSEQTGVFYPLVDRGSYVAQGMIVGYVTDYVGRKVFDARAAASGVVLHVLALPSVNKGDGIVNIGVVGPAR